MSQASTSAPLTVPSDAVNAFAALLSSDEETSQAEAQPDAVVEGADAPDIEASDPEAEPAEESPESDDAEDSEESPAEQPNTLTVKIDGKEETVTLEEAAKGYQRQQDYTRKTQELAEQRRQVETERQQVAEKAARFADGLKVVEKFLTESAPPEPDWDALQKSDPAEFAAKWAEAQRHKAKLEAVTKEREEAERTAQEAKRQQFAEFVQAERKKLLEVVPTWADEKVAREEFAKLHAFGKSRGFSDEDLNGMVDSRAILVLRDAMRYANLKAQPAQPQKRAAVTALKPAATVTTPGQTSDITRQKQRLAKTGRVEDAAHIFQHLV